MPRSRGRRGWIRTGTTSSRKQRLTRITISIVLRLRTLLAERFKLAFHRETKDIAVYALVVAKDGPKFKDEPGSSEGVNASGGDAAPPIPAALQEQLGLKLRAQKAPVEIIVIDRVEKVPTEN
jgi:hypothetical protein